MTAAKKRTLLIDGDVFVYQQAIRNQEVVQFGEDLVFPVAHQAPAWAGLLDTFESIKKTLKATDIIVALSDEENFRTGVYDGYKHNRDHTKRPLLVKILKDRLVAEYGAHRIDGLEADDVLGILQTHLKGETIIVTSDKDLLTIPGKVFKYRPATENKPKSSYDRIVVTEEEADRWFYTQCLTGDRVDGYPGCPGMGIVTAEKLLDKVEEDGGDVWEAIVAAYAKKGLDEEFALSQARCARILRASDYNFKTKEVIPWTPTRAEK